ncbi:MAG: nucleotidyl transferase AbiEii/AbiGii toxin family protein [Actinobacteria bacterium]|nr:nucleotidyl transferase AbiEii/AbiGii toxin family protein [Actinomycetota bacterium]
MRYDTPAGFRDALEQRLLNRAEATGTDINRLRRRAVFERILARLADATGERWILKGGFALEVRLGDRARSTRDLDLALGDSAATGADVRDALIDALSLDRGDMFDFEVREPRDITPDDAGRPGWRFTVTANLAGKEFQKVRVDVVARPEEIGGRTEQVDVSTLLDFADIESVTMETIDRRQHFAEKLHALTRDYGDRPSSRVKDLADLLILIEDGLLPDDDLLTAVQDVFEVRATHDVPDTIPAPPSSWQAEYEAYVSELDLDAADLDVAHQRLDEFWSKARSGDDPQGGTR